MLFLEPGSPRCEGWIEAVVSHGANSADAATFRETRTPARILAGLLKPKRGIALELLISRA